MKKETVAEYIKRHRNIKRVTLDDIDRPEYPCLRDLDGDEHNDGVRCMFHRDGLCAVFCPAFRINDSNPYSRAELEEMGRENAISEKADDFSENRVVKVVECAAGRFTVGALHEPDALGGEGGGDVREDHALRRDHLSPIGGAAAEPSRAREQEQQDNDSSHLSTPFNASAGQSP